MLFKNLKIKLCNLGEDSKKKLKQKGLHLTNQRYLIADIPKYLLV